jgi:response regulator RpfG family c-di-GMP phosphodiesterase
MPHQILVVDDNQINLSLFGILLKKQGDCESHCHLEPLMALEWAKANRVDLVLVDYMMPEIDGIEFVKRFRTLPGHETTPIVMVTANDQKDVRYAALASGVTDFLSKPVDRVEFSSRIKNLLILEDGRRKLADHASWLAEEVLKATNEIRERERETVIRLSKAAESRDLETGAHVTRMALYAEVIAAEMGMAKSEQELLLAAAPLHDIGKVGIPDHILLKPGKLDPAEFAIMKEHTRIGHGILQGSSSKILQLGAVIALTHHEKFDGTGYPDGLSGESIPLFSRIVALADVFDALTTARPYKPAWELDRVVRYINDQAGFHFDPGCVEALHMRWNTVLEIRERFRDE